MSRWLEWLLGLEHIRLDQGPLSVDLSNAPSPWSMLVGGVLVIALMVLMYRYEGGSRRMRIAMCVVRGMILFMVLGIAGRPNLVLRRERVDPSVVAVLVDASASMATADVPPRGAASQPGTAASATSTRYAEALSALTDGARSAMRILSRRHRVELWTFADRAERVDRQADETSVSRLAQRRPTGRASDPLGGVADVLAQTRGARLAAILVLSDGRATVPGALDRVLDEARQRHVPIHTAPFGSPSPPRDVAIEAVQADESAFVKDVISVVAELRSDGYSMPMDTAVSLTDAATGTVLGRLTARFETPASAPAPAASPGAARAEVEFRFRAAAPGRLRLRVAAAVREDEFDRANNVAETTVRVHDEKLRVLYVEGPPRYEYRYLKNTLRREPGIVSSCLLLDATESFVQEGSEPVRAFPATAAELNRYDVVLLGDVDPREDWLSPAQAAMLVDFVGTRGGGVGFIAGERAMPQRVATTALDRLLPVRCRPDGAARTEDLVEAAPPQPTAEGRRHPILRLEVDRAANEAVLAALPGWYWHADVAGLKPGAVALAAADGRAYGGGPTPLIVCGRYGPGRTLFVGSDDVWRWRRGEGEAYYDAFWLNAIRWLAGDRLAAASPWRLTCDRRTYDPSQPVRLRLTTRETPPPTGLGPIPARVDVAGLGPLAQVLLEPAGADAAVYEGAAYLDALPGGPANGGGELKCSAAALVPGLRTETERPTCEFTVRRLDPEHAQIEADYGFLESLARESGGQMVRPAELLSLAAAIPDSGARIADDLIEPLWDTRLVLLLLVAMLAAEWAARKLKGLA